MALKAVIFDMDGVLTDTVEFHYQSWAKVCQEVGIPFTRQDNEGLLGLTRRKSLEKILGEQRLSEDQIEDIMQRKNQYFLEMVTSMNTAELLPGVQPLLEELQAAAVRVAVASASRNAETILEHLGVSSYLDALVDGNTPLPSKPAPDAFLKAAAAVNVQPEYCLAVEDSPSGISAALAAGMCVVGVGQPQLVGEAHAVLPNLKRVRVVDLHAIYNWWHAAHIVSKVGVYNNYFVP